MLRQSARQPVCLTLTHLDGRVLARSAFNHSVNYRSAMLFGIARRRKTTPANARRCATWSSTSTPAAGSSCGPPKDDEEDLTWPVWARVIPLRQLAEEPVPEPGQWAWAPAG